MNRIRFRQPLWDKQNKFAGWHFWGFIDDIFEEPAWSPQSSVKEAREQSQQFIGAFGSPKQDIYAGDIIETKVKMKEGKNRGIVTWIEIDGCFAVDTKAHEIFTVGKTFKRYGGKKIGNGTENPELLEEPK